MNKEQIDSNNFFMLNSCPQQGKNGKLKLL